MTGALSALEIARALEQPSPTEEQRAVIEAPLEPLLVVAGAGSGKTETMSARVVWLVANGLVLPSEVLGLTFTRKAAAELGERIGRRLRQLAEAGLWRRPDDDDLSAIPEVSTYHAYAGRLVAEHGLRLGHEPGARLLSEASAWQLAVELVDRYAGPLDELPSVPAGSTVVQAVLALSSQLSEHLRTPEELGEHLDEVLRTWQALPPGARARSAYAGAADALDALRRRRAVVPLLSAYRRLKRDRESLDFGDQVALAARIARTFPDVGRAERERHRVVLLDEFQDTSDAQLVLLRELFAAGADPAPVMAVGDPHQSIYGWRGASSTTLTSFPRQFPTPDGPARTLPLSTSWRNDEAILAAANVVAGPLSAVCEVPVAQLAPRPGAGRGRVEAARLPDVDEEAAHLAVWLRERMTPADGCPPPTAAVLCRRRAQFPRVVEALERQGLAIEVVGLGGLLTMPEVADLVSFLHVVDDPSRGDHLVRLLTGPPVRLGPADLAALHDWARSLRQEGDEETLGLVEALDALPARGWTSPAGRSLSETAYARLTDLRGRVRRVRDLLSATLPEVVAEAERVLGLDLEVLADPRRPAHEARVHLEALHDVAADYASSAERPTLTGFLDWLTLAEEHERGLSPGEVTPVPGAVQVLTVHASKGLEWDLVAVPGLEEASFPEHESQSRPTDDGRWVVRPPRDKAWLRGLESLPYDLRGDRAGLPRLDWRAAEDLVDLSQRIDAFALAAGEHGVQEERRLAYVALTRARQELLLTAPVWGTQRKPRVTSRFVEELREAQACVTSVWAPMPDTDPPPVNPLLAASVAIPWPAAQAAPPAVARAAELVRAARVGRGARPPSSPEVHADPGWDRLDEEIDVLLRERAQGPSGGRPASLPAHLSTSALVSLADDRDAFLRALRRPMPSPPATAARRGTAFHAWVEQHYARAAMLDLDELPGSADDGLLDEADVEVMREHFLAGEWSGRTPVEIELPVESTVAGTSIRGRIDAVFPRDDGGFTVVDWKTGARPSGRRARVRELQLAVYRLAYARLRGLDLDRVDGAFYYAATGETVRPPLPDERGLEQLVRGLVEDADGG